MQKTSTQLNLEISELKPVNVRPKAATVNFIKQFARVYSCNDMLRPNLGGFLAN